MATCTTIDRLIKNCRTVLELRSLILRIATYPQPLTTDKSVALRCATGWSTGAFSPTPGLWTPVNASPAAASSLPMRALAMPISTVIRKVQPSSVTALSGGGFLYKFPRNFVGTIEIAPLPAAENNSSLTVLLGEWLDAGKPDSSQDSSGHSYRGPREYPSISGSINGQQYENHVLVNGNTEPLTTLFCYHGFQWVRVDSANHTGFVSQLSTCLNLQSRLMRLHQITVALIIAAVDRPCNCTGSHNCANALQTGKLDALVALEIHTNVTSTGTLRFFGDGLATGVDEGTEVLAHINQMTLNSQLSNLPANIPTDCPTRCDL